MFNSRMEQARANATVLVHFTDIVRESAKAKLYRIDGRLEWLPNSRVRISGSGMLEVERWLVDEKQLPFVGGPDPVRL